MSVGLQYGNAFGRGFQAAALKPADFFGNDDVLYLMEDMATGEIRLSILWEWLHKGARLTEDDPETGSRAGDTFSVSNVMGSPDAVQPHGAGLHVRPAWSSSNW